MNTSRKHIHWIIATLTLMFMAISFFASVIIYIDPLFHFHAPLDNFDYPIIDQRYQNDGITRHFEYDGIITGSSMTENFKTSEADEFFNARFIKVSFSGGYYKEINSNLRRAYQAGKEIKFIIRCLDYSLLVLDKDTCRTDVDYPTYLYNNNLFDDLNYVLNKSILFDRILNREWGVVEYTRAGKKTTSFDAYANWNAFYTFGAAAVLDTYSLGEPANTSRVLTKEEEALILENIRQNVTDLADEHPETTFYLFFSPYSICYWDSLNNSKSVDWQIDAEQIAIEEILKHPNIRLYSFSNNFELVCNLDNYKDQAHYGEWVNSWILEWLYMGEHILTWDNYQEYIEEMREFYNNYDYESIHKQKGQL